MPAMDFDDVLEELGEFGRYQITNYLLICLPVFFSAANSLSYVFTAGVPHYRCYIPGCDDAEGSQFDSPWVPSAVPALPNTNGESTYTPQQCLRYAIRGNATLNGTECVGDFSDVEERCDRWVFQGDEHTIVGEWDITCSENQWRLAMVGTVHFAGILIGSSVFGFLADKIGRKVVFIFCIVLMSLTGIAQAVSTNYSMFQVFVFINALGTAGVYPLAFIIGVELVGRRKREMSGIVLNYFYALGEAAVGLIAYLTKNWIIIQCLVSAPALVFTIYYWFIPESVRWLLAKRQNSRAGYIIRKAADINGVVLSERLLSNFSPESSTATDKAEEAANEGKEDKGMLDTLLEICRSRKLLLRSLNLFFCWAANAFVYYGLSVNSTSLGGNKYLNFALVCLVEIPGYTLSWVSMNRLGRRKSLAASLLLCSVTCVGAAFVPAGMYWAEVTLFLIGKLGITCSFGVVCVYTAELYPTVMRSAGVGASSTIARIGAMIAPFAPLLGEYSKPLPLLLFGAVSFITCLLSLLFPETLGAKLPDTFEEIEKL